MIKNYDSTVTPRLITFMQYVTALNNFPPSLSKDSISEYKSLEVVGEEQYNEGRINKANDYRFCKCYNIHKKLGKYIKCKLEEDGITRDYTYPDEEKINTRHVYEQCISEQ